MKSSAIFSRDFVVGQAQEGLFGSFLEHGGRAIYGGVYDPDSPQTDPDGMRQDVAGQVRELGVSLVRYPGGNFVSQYDWKDTIGPKDKRPVRTELAWQSLESNQFGLDEFMTWCKAAGVEPMITLNLATRGVQDARDILEYCNFPGGTYWSEQRRANGADKPYGVRYWCLGNEMDGDWQVGQKTADEYGLIAREAAKAMRYLDPDIKLTACYTTSLGMDKHNDWGTRALMHCYDYVDYISLHKYCTNEEKSTPDFMAQTLDLERYIDAAIASCDYVKSILHSPRTMMLAFDEWNVWYHSVEQDAARPRWLHGQHVLEDVYNFEDAVVVGLNLIMLLRRCDRVKLACLAQLVNVIAPIMTDDAGRCWRQTIYYPFLHVSRYGRGTVLQGVVDSPRYTSAKFGETPYLDIVAVHREAEGEITVFAVNRSEEEEMDLCCELRDFGPLRMPEQIEYTSPDKYAENTADAPDTCLPAAAHSARVEDRTLHARLKPLSWNVLRLKIETEKEETVC